VFSYNHGPANSLTTVGSIRRQALLFLMAAVLSGYVSAAYASITIRELIEHGEHYQQKGLSVMGYASGLTILSGPRDRPFYTFTLSDGLEMPEIVTVIMQGKPELANGDRVYVYGVFFKSRKAGRTTITNRIEAHIVERLFGAPLIG
jgi:hypothetical protein